MMREVTQGMLTVHEVAQALAVKESTIRAWLLRRKLSCCRLSSRCVRIPRSEVERLVREGTAPAREVA
jgi:excisionase family DNA binding protein